MSSIRGISMLALALVAGSVTAQSADLYGGRGGSIKDAPMYAPVQSGCPQWYARVDGGYSTFDKPTVVELGVDDWIRSRIDDTWSVGGGIGRYFSCNIRGDVTVDYRFKSEVSGENANPFTPMDGTRRFDLGSTVVLGNLYYDFDTSGSRFRPYIGIGLGGVHHKISTGSGIARGSSGANAGDLIEIGGSSNWHVAGALMAGFSLQLRERLNFDAGYRYLYLGEASTGEVRMVSGAAVGASAGRANVEDIHAHEFRFGLRYDIR